MRELDDGPIRFMTVALDRKVGKIVQYLCTPAVEVTDADFIKACKDHPDVYAVFRVEQVWPAQ